MQLPQSLPFVGGKKTSVTQHPIGQLTASEITESVKLIKSSWPAGTDIQFKAVTLEEPKKAELAPYLVAERKGDTLPVIERRSFVLYYIRNTVSVKWRRGRWMEM